MALYITMYIISLVAEIGHEAQEESDPQKGPINYC